MVTARTNKNQERQRTIRCNDTDYDKGNWHLTAAPFGCPPLQENMRDNCCSYKSLKAKVTIATWIRISPITE